MPKAALESGFKRFMTQAIMWLVLACTVGAAELVNRSKFRAVNVPLGEVVQFEGFSIQLPADWERIENVEDALAVYRDSSFGDVLEITLHRPSFFDMLSLGANRGGRLFEEIDFGGQTVPLLANPSRSADDEPQVNLSASRSLPSGRILTLSLSFPYNGSYLRERNLVKRIAASAKVDIPRQDPAN